MSHEEGLRIKQSRLLCIAGISEKVSRKGAKKQSSTCCLFLCAFAPLRGIRLLVAVVGASLAPSLAA